MPEKFWQLVCQFAHRKNCKRGKRTKVKFLLFGSEGRCLESLRGKDTITTHTPSVKPLLYRRRFHTSVASQSRTGMPLLFVTYRTDFGTSCSRLDTSKNELVQAKSNETYRPLPG
jgi:hypothetical protein